MLPLMIQSPSLDLSLSFSLCYQSFIEYRPALSLTKREKHQHTRAKLKPFNDSRAAAICSCEYEQALFYLPHTHGQSLAHWRSLILDLSIATLVLASLCVSMCLSVSECEWEWVQISSWNQTASRKRETHSLNQSVGIYSFDQSIVGTWSTNQSINHHHWETLTRIVCFLEATHDTWVKSLTRHQHHQQLSLFLSMMMIWLFAQYHCNQWSTMTIRWRSARERERPRLLVLWRRNNATKSSNYTPKSCETLTDEQLTINIAMAPSLEWVTSFRMTSISTITWRDRYSRLQV